MSAATVLIVAAFATALLSGLIGMGGGMLLLATLFCFLPHAEAVPTHATVQLASNSTRMLAFLRHVDWRTFGGFLLGSAPGLALGSGLLLASGPPERSEPYLKMAVGLYILVAAYLPKGRKASAAGRWWEFPLLGAVAGTAALTVGAVGPLIAPLFARRDFVKERLIATKAVCQMALHLAKIPVFLAVRSIDYARLGGITLVMAVVVIPGTLLGKRLLRFVSEEHFRLLYRVALTVAGAKVLVWDGVYALVGRG